MNFGKTEPNWFDLVVLGLIGWGIFRGKKRGMSEELLDLFQWLTIVVVGALLYAPFGKILAKLTNFSPFLSNITSYAIIACVIKMIFAGMKRAVGEKLVQSDTFGNFEYYLGMIAGPVRYLCILIFVLSFLHAKHISDAERAAMAKVQAENFGSITFPTFGSLQQTIFHESVAGAFIRKNLHAQLVQPAAGRARTGETIGRRRERAVEEVMK